MRIVTISVHYAHNGYLSWVSPYDDFIEFAKCIKDEFAKDELVKDEFVKDEFVKDEFVKDEFVKDEFLNLT